jgi:hypothetical protein
MDPSWKIVRPSAMPVRSQKLPIAAVTIGKNVVQFGKLARVIMPGRIPAESVAKNA